jgi:hypothetical protein
MLLLNFYDNIPRFHEEVSVMRFTVHVKASALDNQIANDGNGCCCSECGKFINPLPYFEMKNVDGGWYAVPCDPEAEATGDNCMIVCPQCYHQYYEIQQN